MAGAIQKGTERVTGLLKQTQKLLESLGARVLAVLLLQGQKNEGCLPPAALGGDTSTRRISHEGPWKSRKQKGSQMVWDDTMPGAYRLSSLCFWAPCVGVEPCLLGREPCPIGYLIS